MTFSFYSSAEPIKFRPNNTPFLLDLLLINDENLIPSIEYPPSISRSDHVIILYKLQIIQQITSTNITMTFQKVDYDKLQYILAEHNWENFSLSQDINTKYTYTISEGTTIYNKSTHAFKPQMK